MHFLFTNKSKFNLFKIKEMLLFTQNQENIAYLTLSEAVTLTATPVYFLFKFKSLSTNDEVICSSANITTAITRYDQFVFTLTGATSPNLNYTGGTIYMNPPGEWTYEAYEMYSASNLSISATSGVVLEKGILTLSGSSVDYITQNYTGQSQTYGFYNP
jgi:hypothetical protein